MAAKLLEKLLQKTILLHPTSEGVLEPIDITGIDKGFISNIDKAGNQRTVEVVPTRIYQVRGLKRIKKIAIHDYNTTQLLDLYSKDHHGGMSEKMLADLLDISYHKGLKDAGPVGEMNAKLAQSLHIIIILSGIAAIISVIQYIQK